MKCNKSELIKAGVTEGFRNGTSKYATRRCYGYDITIDGSLVMNPDEAKICSLRDLILYYKILS